jgi:WD40 repeat protein
MKNNAIISNLITLPYEALSVCISSDDSTIYVGGRDNNIHIYQVNGDGDGIDETNKLSGAHLRPIHSLALSNDGTKLASADTRDICVWNVQDGYSPIIDKSRWCFHQQQINALAWSNDDSILASGGNDDSIYFWSLKKKTTRVHYPHSHRGGITALEFLKNEDGMVLVSVGNDACVNQWDVTDDVMNKFG